MLSIFREIIHPVLLREMPKRRNFKLEILNDQPQTPKNRIYVMNHSSMHDMPIASEAIKEHYFVLVGKQPLYLADKFFFWLNGVIYIDRKSKQSKKRGFYKMLEILRKGNNLLIYPEGTWNTTPSRPLIPLNWGVVELAKKAEVPIVPLVAEYYPDCCYVKFGNLLYMHDGVSKENGIQQVEETMATLKWDIWELLPVVKRTEGMQREFQQMIEERIKEYPKLDIEYEKSVIRGWQDSPEYVLQSIDCRREENDECR